MKCIQQVRSCSCGQRFNHDTNVTVNVGYRYSPLGIFVRLLKKDFQ
jgi:hypothetical protein